MGLGYGALSWLYSASLRRVAAWLGTTLFYVYPVVTAILAWAFLGERPGRNGLRALALSLTGCMLIVCGPAMGASPAGADVAGVFMALGSGVCYAAYSVAVRKLVTRADPVVTSARVILASGALYAALMPVSGGFWAPSSLRAWAVVAGLALFATAVPMVALLSALQSIGATLTAILGTFEPAVSAALAVVLLGERLSLVQAAGMLLVISGGVTVKLTCEPGEAHEART
jgi:drug/metabolite transporter (DMT)-like permease